MSMEYEKVTRGKFWKENRFVSVYQYMCEQCGRHRETRNREKALANDNVCDKCKKAKVQSEDQQTLF